jgi:hypothetical protein
MLDDAPLPQRYDVDECIAVPVDPTTLLVYWEVRKQTRNYLEKTHGPGDLVLRAVVVQPTWDGPKTELRDIVVTAEIADFYVRNLPEDAVVRVAVGYRQAGLFRSLAHSPLFQAQGSYSEPHTTGARGSELTTWTRRSIDGSPASISEREQQTLEMLAAKHTRQAENKTTKGTEFGGSSWHEATHDTRFR